MRQFILAAGFTALDGTDPSGVSAGNLTMVIPDNKCANLVYRRTDGQGGDILFPIYPKDLTYTVAEYAAGVRYKAAFTIPEITPFLDYTVTFIKKGLKFNERNKWSAVVHAGATATAETIAEAIVKFVNANKAGLGLEVVTAETTGATITVQAVKVGEDYAITFGDDLYGTALTSETKGKEAFMDAAMIKDLFNKAAADRGYEYTYDDFDIYPGFEFNPLKAADAQDTGFKVYTIRFTEPRLMGTREEAVYQIIQVAFPTGATETLDEVLDAFIGKAAEEEETEAAES